MKSQARILVVDDEVHLADGIRENLEAEGYTAQAAYDGEQGLHAALSHDYDLIVLDVMMPKLDGIQVCAELREAQKQTPVLFLTVKASTEDRIQGLAAGGDDYMSKPFHLDELLLRIAAILKRSAWYRTSTDEPFTFGGNTIDFRSYTASSWDGATHDLTHKEAMIARALSARAGEIVTREEILDQVWGNDVYPSTRTIDNFIVRLRKRFEKNPELPDHFHTVRGVGYRFTRDPEPERGNPD